MQSRHFRQSDPVFKALLEKARWVILFAVAFLVIPGTASADTFAAKRNSFFFGTFANPESEDTLSVTQRSIATPADVRTSFGPFRVTAPDRVEMDGASTAASPAEFAALLRQFPGIKTLVMINCPGSEDDDANLKLARMIRHAGIDTVLPTGGSIRSGAVELFLAGRNRIAQPGATIGVHSWVDENGYEATDYPPTDPVHSTYIRYYVDMGMAPSLAKAFYDFTNRAAPSSYMHFMSSAEVRKFRLVTGS